MSTRPTGQLYVWMEGKRGRILTYVRPNGRCPSCDFLEAAEKRMFKRFNRTFQRFCAEGMSIAENTTFKPMSLDGKGIWAFKEHDHRLLCFRGPDSVDQPANPGEAGKTRQQIVLLLGWVKDKSDSLEERAQVDRAQALREECESCVDWNHVIPTRPPKTHADRLREDLTDPLLDPAFQAELRRKLAVVAPEILLPSTESVPAMAAKGPAKPPRTYQPPEAEYEPLPVPLPAPTEPAQPMQTQPEPQAPTQTTETKAAPQAESKPSTVSMRGLAKLAGVPYIWLWTEVKKGHLDGWKIDINGNKFWPWDGIDAVVAKIEELRKRMHTKPDRKPKEQTPQDTPPSPPPATDGPQAEPLLTMGRVARLVGLTKGQLRHAVANGSVKPAEVRDGIRLFRESDVRLWLKNRSPNNVRLDAPTELAPVDREYIDSLLLDPIPHAPAKPAAAAPDNGNSKPYTKATLHSWLDDLLSGKRHDTRNFIVEVRRHMVYRQKLEAELKALTEDETHAMKAQQA